MSVHNPLIKRGANKYSKTGVKNVHFCENANQYRVMKFIQGKQRHIKSFNSFSDACDFAEKMNQYDLNNNAQLEQFLKWVKDEQLRP